jgi:phosphoglycerate dehydrogenase-like enzyme
VTARPRVLFGRERFTAELDWTDLTRLLPGWEVVASPPDRLAEHLDGVAAVCPFGAWVDQAVLESGSFGLVHQYGVGLEKVDVTRATELGVWVSRVPGDAAGNADSVAELAVLFLLALARRFDEARSALTARRWERRPTGGSLLGATVLIVGLGAIGVAVARRLAPFGTRLLGVRARPGLGAPPEVERVAGPDQLLDLLGEADAVVCCAMFDGSNSGMFGPAAFGAMRPGAWFVNVARGGLVDEAALLAALQSGHVAGAGLDVYAREPADPDTPLLRHPGVIATPHVGGLTHVMFRRTAEVFAANLRRWADGGAPRWAVNAPEFCRWPPAQPGGGLDRPPAQPGGGPGRMV